MKLLTISNAKTTKGEAQGYLTGILYLAPHTLSGFNVCPYASAGCASSCLNTAGRGRFSNVQEARLKKTNWFFDDRDYFIEQLQKDIDAIARKAKREGLKPTVRLNGTSDLNYLRLAPWLFTENPDVIFYDYTKDINRIGALKTLHDNGRFKNYSLTFSLSEEKDSKAKAIDAMTKGVNVAVVFRDVLPNALWARPVINGDLTDLRFLDNNALDGLGQIVGLKAKGEAKKDLSGFVLN